MAWLRYLAGSLLLTSSIGLSGCSDGPETPQDFYREGCKAQFGQTTNWGGIATGFICSCRADMAAEYLTGRQMRAYAQDPMGFTISLIGSDLADDVSRTENTCTRRYCDRYENIEPQMCALFRSTQGR